MTTSGGGWTLVWSNTRGGKGKVVTELQFDQAIKTSPLVRGQLDTNVEAFTVFTGLDHWASLSPQGSLRYDWSPNFGVEVTHRIACPYSLNPADNYRLQFTADACVQDLGAPLLPGLVSVHNGAAFSAYDRDNDTLTGGNCALNYSKTPWWYVACYSGSIHGGGENSCRRSQWKLLGGVRTSVGYFRRPGRG